MKSGIIIAVVIVVLLVAGGVFYLMKPKVTSPGTNVTPSGNEITIQNFAFSPATLTIKAGDTVTWTNKDSMAHTVTSDTGAELASSPLSSGATYSHTFNTAGTYDYHCSIHTSMKAKIVVQ